MNYIFASQRWLSDFRLKLKNIAGRSHYDIFPEIPAYWKEIHRRCLAGATEKNDEEAFHRSDGITDWVRWEVRPWYDLNDTIGGILIFSEDISARKKTEEALKKAHEALQSLNDELELKVQARTAELAASEHKHRALFEGAYDSILVADLNGNIVSVNPQLEKIFGYESAELVGKPIETLIPERLRQGHVGLFVHKGETEMSVSLSQILGQELALSNCLMFLKDTGKPKRQFKREPVSV